MNSSQQLVEQAQETPTSSKLLEMATRFYEKIFTGSAEELIPTILSEVARVFEVDIATWFLVTEDRRQLSLVDVYNDLGNPEEKPPTEPYELNWSAASEDEVVGLTAWTAVSGEPLFVDSIDSLTKRHGKCHAGRWDKWLYPKDIWDSESGFLCMYAVPLLLPLPEPESKQQRVVGVLKMERRNKKGDRKREVFNRNDLDSFNVIARIMGFAYFHSERQKSLTLLDIGHALIRPLGDVAFSLDAVQDNLETTSIDPKITLQIRAASTMLHSLARMLSLAKDSYNQPLYPQSVDIYNEVMIQSKAISLTSGRNVVVREPSDPIGSITLKKRSQAALMNVINNLLQNATQNSQLGSEVYAIIEQNESNFLLIVENSGTGVPENVIEDAQRDTKTPQFRGLPRSYELAAQNGWQLKYEYIKHCQTNRFTLTVPIHP